MNFVNFLVVLISCAALCAAFENASDNLNKIGVTKRDHNLIQCKEPPAATWVIKYRGNVDTAPSLLGVRRETVVYPESGIGQETITCIRVTDKVSGGNGGYPSIKEGGVDFKYVILEFESQWYRSMRFDIEIYVEPAA